jgi:predicted outer membrane protein
MNTYENIDHGEVVLHQKKWAHIEAMPKWKWGYMPIKTRDKASTPSVIGLISVWLQGQESQSITRTDIFTAVLPDGRLHSIPSIEALGYLRAEPSENLVMHDRMVYDRHHINKRSVSIAEQKAPQKNQSHKITSTQTKVLDALATVFPGRDISNLLMNVETIQDERQRDKLFREVVSNLKEHNAILPQVLEQIAKLIDALSSRVVQKSSTVAHTTPIFYYGK